MKQKKRSKKNGCNNNRCHVERYIEGKYIKYNNNKGWVSQDERNTPHAFAHYTFQASRGKLLVCDIQGVNDIYTFCFGFFCFVLFFWFFVFCFWVFFGLRK